jgi:hypothetical protein
MTRFEYQQYGAMAMAKRGSELPQSKLDESTVRAIRENRHGLTANQWASLLGLHQRTIDKVRDRRSWMHI